MTTTSSRELALVETPTGPTTPPPTPKPTTGQKIDTAGSLIVLAGALTGLGFHAQNGPDLVGYPIGATLAAIVIAAVVLVRTPPRTTR